jgi:preprotein translocase subunit SecF
MPLLRFIPETTNVDFVKYRWWAFGVDGLLMVMSVVAFIALGFNMGLDFTGGSQIELKSAKTIDIAHLRAEVEGLNFGHPTITTVGGGGCIQPVDSCAVIRVPPQVIAGLDANQSNQRVVQTIRQTLGKEYTIRSVEQIGPKISGELFSSGILATVLAVLCISAWVWFRFEWQYGVGALIATGHDVLVVAGFYAVFQWEFNLNTVAALLLLAGYSINDTVVVFDRIRENRRKYKRMSLPDLINLSTNHIATRTTLVSVATALSVLPLLFGGPVLLNFSRAILIGILVGTFSSTYVASALLLYMPPVGGKSAGGAKEDTAEAVA